MIVTNSIAEAVTEGKYRKAPTFREFISFLVDTKVSVYLSIESKEINK